MKSLILLGLLPLIWLPAKSEIMEDNVMNEYSGFYTIEGRVYPPEEGLVGFHSNAPTDNKKWQTETVLSINNGEYKGFIRDDGSFVISSMPPGSYILEILNADYFYEPVRVEINSKGKFRARKVNYIQPSQGDLVPYPLNLKASTRFKYFKTREQWKITDYLFRPMVLMMVLPLVLMWALPKLVKDPKTKMEIENMQFPKLNNDLPEISEMISSLFAEKKKQPPTNAKEANKKKDQS